MTLLRNYYEVYDPGGANEEVTKYYYASGKRIAMRKGDALYWIHGDHFTSRVPVERGTKRATEMRWMAFEPSKSNFSLLSSMCNKCGDR